MCKKLIITLVASILLVGCSSGTTTNQGTEQAVVTTTQRTTEAATEQTTTQETEKTFSNDGSLENSKVVLGEAKKVKSEVEEGDILEVNYTFTNNSEEAISAGTALIFTAYQDGVEINNVFDYSITGDNPDKKVKKGVSIECKALFKLESNSDVEVEVKEFLGEDKVVKVYTLQ